jgi:undecaprenyl-phosphate galactose phosphotransferase
MKFFRGLAAGTIMVVFDAGALAGCYVLAYVLRLTLLMDVFPSLQVPLSFDMFVQRYYLLLVYLLVFAYEGLYAKRLVLWEEVRRVLRGTVLATVLVILALYVTRAYVLSRSVVLLAMLLSFLVLPVFRTLAKQLAIGLRLWSKSVIIVGQDRNAQVLKSELERNWRLGYHVVAVLDPQILRQQRPAEVFGLLREHRAESFVLSDASVGRGEAARFLGQSEAPGGELIVLLDSSSLQSVGVEVEQLESLLLMKYRYNLLQPLNILLKRVLEIAFGGFLLIVLLPLLAVLARIVRLGSPGPVLFVQDRIGKNRRLFRCLKFRTMWQDADQRLEKMLAADSARREEWMRFSRITNDPRITRPGRFLRRFSLDELPQLWNVLRGEMSLVGPRPYMPRETDKIGDFMEIITRVRPGITGLYQISGRKELTFDERLLLDEHYVKNWSLWMDFVIVLRTVRVVLQGAGAL